MRRIGIIIGVNKPKSPPPLQGAVSDAKAFASWIESQGFEVKKFTDDVGRVTHSDIFDEVERVVSSATYSQIVIYFAGHGYQNSGSEVWLLSGAPDNQVEAISIEASVLAARESGIRSVVFISDACRSIPTGMQANRVDGVSIFPNKSLKRKPRPQIDRVFATLPSLVAVEAAKADDAARRGGVFTHEFMKGYRDPPAEFVQTVDEDGNLVEVVTNRDLKELISDLVEDAAADEIATAQQMPEFILESVSAYVGRVERSPNTKINNPNPDSSVSRHSQGKILGRPEPETQEFQDLSSPFSGGRRRRKSNADSVTTLARQAIGVAVDGRGALDAAAIARGSGRGAEISDAILRYSGQAPVFETGTGFSVTGAAVVGAVSPLFQTEVLGSQQVRVWPEDTSCPSTSVLVEFAAGSGIMLPALRGYIGHIFVDQGAVTNVNYVPSSKSSRWRMYQNVKSDVEAVRAAVAAAAGAGVFRVAPEEAKAFATKMRELRVFDPALELYAAYAYSYSGVENEVEATLGSMRNHLRAELFDVAMLARRDVRPREGASTEMPILPFCPMLRQGWPLLSGRNAQLPDIVRQARDWLLPAALWTTFAPQGVALLRQAISTGDLR